MLLHELFHAYQDWLGKPITKSRMEAEAYLAEVDYLYHNDHSIPDAWYAFLLSSKATTLPSRFNVPISVLKKVIDVPFESPQYKRVVEIVGDNYIWSILYQRFSRPGIQSVIIAEGFKRANLPMTELRSTWKKVCEDVVKKPGAVSNIGRELETKIAYLLVATQYYIKRLWDAGRKTEAASVVNKTFEAFKGALRLTKLSKFDVAMSLGGHSRTKNL
jgi:hypothetical protein